MSASCKVAKDRAPYIRSAFVGLLLSTTLGGTAFAQQAQTKQTADIAASDTTEEQDATKQPSDIVVTGTATAQRKFDVSYAVTSLSNAAIRQLAPLSFADLLSQVPGILAESTGGEVQNVYRLRGIPNEGGFQAFHQDGMPIYHDNDGFFFKGDVLNRIDLMTKTVEFVRGGPAPIFGSNASAIYNQITVTGTQTPHGAVQFTAGNTDLFRLDTMTSGPIDEHTTYAMGGFIRHHQGYRDSGFPSDRGGQFRANLRHEAAFGTLTVSGLYLNDHNVFFLPIPIADPRNPAVSLNPYIDYFTGTLNTPVLRNATMRYAVPGGGQTTETRDLGSGRYTRLFSGAMSYEGDFNGWQPSFKMRFTKGKLSFDALYSTSNPADGNSFAAGYLTRVRTAFGPSVARLGYAIGGTGGAQVYDPYAASGLVIAGQYRAVEADFFSAQADLRLTKAFDTAIGRHQVTIGTYGANYGDDFRMRYQDYLFEVASRPRTLDLYAYDANGRILGSVTKNGVLRYATTVNGGKSDITMYALYGNDNWQITDRLRIDAGIRHEKYAFRGYGLLQGQIDLGDRTTLADDATRYFTGAVKYNPYDMSVTNWTVGGDFDLTDRIGFYGRVSREAQVPGEGIVYSGAVPVINRANQYEAGVKIDYPILSLYLTGFYTKFDPYNASFIAYNPQTGRTDQSLTFIGTAKTKGVEIDATLRPAPWFQLASAFTFSDPTIGNLFNETGASAAAVEGNQLIRQPKNYGNIRPTFTFHSGDATIATYLRWNYVGRRYVDLFNRTQLPSYNTLAAGITMSRSGWEAQIVGDNITNARGLTEGNTRTDTLSGQGTPTAIYGRPLFGRNVRLVLTKRW
ncbi:TonB-dependent receptor domain-containing protein [Sphingomonas paucimobilis]|uniref:TonB-dependent receptor n=1 Tax=Sphingomonas paucimobilis TaxID=13689 RepID=UPI0028D67D88|nr:TonB-dependent receptor [Sphingomonas paucimobilis]